MPPGQSSDPNSIIVGNCISCEGLVRVSARTKANAAIRCPHCQETFPLLRLLESSVPEVEVVEPAMGANTSAETGPAKETQSANLHIDKGAETGSSESRERSSGADEHSQSRDSEGVAQQSHRSTRHRDSRIEQERKAENSAVSDFADAGPPNRLLDRDVGVCPRPARYRRSPQQDCSIHSPPRFSRGIER